MGKKEREELKNELDSLLKDPTEFQKTSHLTGWQPSRVTGVLARSVLLLDKSSERLSLVLIGLTVIIVLATLVQIWLMFKGH